MMALYRDLFVETVRDPAAAARRILSVRLATNTLWLALALATVLNTIAFQVSNMVVTATQPMMPMMPPMMAPGPVMIMLVSVLIVTVFAMTWLGQSMGGTGTLARVLALVTWLQFMRLGVQVAAIAVLVISPGLANMAMFAAGLYGLYIMVHFMNEAHEFNSLGKAASMIVFGVIGLAFGMAIILTVINAASIGITGNV